MTQRSETAHRIAEFKARLQMKLAARLFSTEDTALNRLLKRLLGAERKEPYSDPELEHPKTSP